MIKLSIKYFEIIRQHAKFKIISCTVVFLKLVKVSYFNDSKLVEKIICDSSNV
jgi:hypothetical protein